jgi:hypothetical protein
MRKLSSGLLLAAGAMAIASVTLADPASAFCFPASACAPKPPAYVPPTPTPQPAPGPMIGFGLPLAGAALGALLIVRRSRNKD